MAIQHLFVTVKLTFMIKLHFLPNTSCNLAAQKMHWQSFIQISCMQKQKAQAQAQAQHKHRYLCLNMQNLYDPAGKRSSALVTIHIVLTTNKHISSKKQNKTSQWLCNFLRECAYICIHLMR